MRNNSFWESDGALAGKQLVVKGTSIFCSVYNGRLGKVKLAIHISQSSHTHTWLGWACMGFAWAEGRKTLPGTFARGLSLWEWKDHAVEIQIPHTSFPLATSIGGELGGPDNIGRFGQHLSSLYHQLKPCFLSKSMEPKIKPGLGQTVLCTGVSECPFLLCCHDRCEMDNH